MRIALFFDGNNYYRALRDFDQGLDVDLERLAAWVTRRVGGEDARFAGAYYYTGTFTDPTEGGQALAEFLDVLETLTGFFVRREPRVKRVTVCRSCHASTEYFTEKRVDTRMVAELIQLAAVNAYDAAVVLSGDGDFVPAVQAVAALGKQVFIGAWPGQRISRELRAHSFGVVDLGDGVAEVTTRRRRPAEPMVPSNRSSAEIPFGSGATKSIGSPAEDGASLAETEREMLAELRLAEQQLPYVSRWYFLNKWRGTGLPANPEEREAILSGLVAVGLVEEFTAEDASQRPKEAIRAR